MKRVDVSLSERAYRALEEQIVTLAIAPGAIVTEQDLASAAGYGRTPVREAVQQLERDMLLQILPRRGILIAPIDVPHALMTLDVRVRLEPMLMERAARLAEEIDRLRFLRLAEQIEACVADRAPEAFAGLDRRFTDLAMQCARHDVAARVVLSLHAVWRRIGYYHSTLHPDLSDTTARIHIRLARAVAADDRSAIAEAMDALFEACRSVALSIEAEHPGAADPGGKSAPLSRGQERKAGSGR